MRVTVAGSMDPVTVIALVAISRPSNIAPESPMKIFAGLQLCGKNPTTIPRMMALISPAVEKKFVGVVC